MLDNRRVPAPSSRSERRLRVAFDDQIFNAQLRGGISKYFVELMQRLPEHGIDPVLLSTKTRNLHLAETGWVTRLPPQSQRAETVKWVSWRVTGHPRSAPRPLPQFDLMHHTFTNGAYLRGWRGPRIVTVFDMTPELYPSYFTHGNPHFEKRRYTRDSDAIISITENTAQDLYRIYSDNLRSKTHVIPFGVGEEFFDSSADTLDLPERYLLFVGVRYGYKDFETGLAAFARMAVRDPGLALVVVGGGPFSPDETASIAATGAADRVIKLTPPDRDMPEVYRRARAFMFPSIYEGFGLPTLESLAAGTPAVLADASCSREVGGSVALYFSPGDVDDLVATLRLAMSPDEQARAAVEGPARGHEFTWDRVAAMTADLYRSVFEQYERT
jgi:glycosyltransferase involved in cell wall biosynthesis